MKKVIRLTESDLARIVKRTINEQYDEFEDEDNDTPTLKDKIESVIRDSITNKEEIIHTLEEILREKKGIGHVTRDKVRKHWDR